MPPGLGWTLTMLCREEDVEAVDAVPPIFTVGNPPGWTGEGAMAEGAIADGAKADGTLRPGILDALPCVASLSTRPENF